MKKAKILSFIFAVLLLAANAFATTVSIPAITGTNGQTSLIFPINVDSVTNLGGYEFTVTYDTAVLNCTTSARGTLTASLFEPPTNNFTVPGTARTLAVMSTGPATGSGDIATVTCTIVGTPGSSTNLTFTELAAHTLLIDGDFADLPATYVNGSFTVFGSSCTPTNGGVEICDNIDNDCDGTVDENLTQPNACGLGACASTGTETCTAGVWGGNTCVPGTPTAEVCDNIDNNCDGVVDSFTRATTCGSGDCAGTGAETCTAGVWGGDTCVILTPITWYLDADTDTYGVDSTTLVQCSQPAGYANRGGDCNDSTTGGTAASQNRGRDIYPGAADSFCNNADNDCDGTLNDGYVPQTITCGIGACQANGTTICLPAGFVTNNCTPNAPTQEGPAGNASCFDGIDNDCDGSADAADVDCEQPETVSIPTNLVGINGNVVNIPVNVGDASGIAGYQFGINYNPAVLDCTDATAGSLTGGFDAPTVNATIPGYINVLSLDPNLAELSGGTGSLVKLQCTVVGSAPAGTDITFDESTLMDSNTDEIPSVPLPGHFDVASCIPTNNGVEICDGLDNDCDGNVDEGMNTTTLKVTCGVGACVRLAQRVCQGTSGWVDTCTPGTPGVEGPVGDATCNDGKDNDCDGTTDASDTNSCQQPAAAGKVSGLGSTATGTLSLAVNTLFPSKGWLKYSAQGISLQSTKISSASVAGTTATVTGTASVNGAAGCGFTATVTDGTPDTMGIVITPGGACATSHSAAPAATTSGFFTIQ